MPDEPTAADVGLAPPPPDEHKPPGRASDPWTRPSQEPEAPPEPEQPAEELRQTLQPSEVADRLVGELAPDEGYEPTPEYAAALEEADHRLATEQLRGGKPVDDVAADLAEREKAMAELKQERPGIDSDAAIEAMTPIYSELLDRGYPPEYVTQPDVLAKIYDAVNTDDRFAPVSEEERAVAEAMGGLSGATADRSLSPLEARRTADGRVELVEKPGRAMKDPDLYA